MSEIPRDYGRSPGDSSDPGPAYVPPHQRTPEQRAAISRAEAALAEHRPHKRPAIGNSDEDVSMVIAYVASRTRGGQDPLEQFCREWRKDRGLVSPR